MITRVEIQNYRSFVDTAVDLKPFTLVIGPNGSGKTNFLRLFRDLNDFKEDPRQDPHSHQFLALGGIERQYGSGISQ